MVRLTGEMRLLWRLACLLSPSLLRYVSFLVLFTHIHKFIAAETRRAVHMERLAQKAHSALHMPLSKGPQLRALEEASGETRRVDERTPAPRAADGLGLEDASRGCVAL